MACWESPCPLPCPAAGAPNTVEEASKVIRAKACLKVGVNIASYLFVFVCLFVCLLLLGDKRLSIYDRGGVKRVWVEVEESVVDDSEVRKMC